jgi:C-terminal processing protease CtpA/Prc
MRKAIGIKTPITVGTEGSEVQPFQGRVLLLVDRHTASANEMLIAFARENKLATIVGEATPGRVLGGNKFKIALWFSARCCFRIPRGQGR